MTPTSRTLKLLKSEGKISGIVEHWNAFTHQRKDLFGFIDIISLDATAKKIWGVQCTSTGNMNARIKKIKIECAEYALEWLKSGGYIEVIGWSKKGKCGKRKLWQPSRKEITLQDFV